ncbi:MAG TPA: serine/threonine-protein kinase, partial [Mycobacteriales bacterium]|nr:serine/threonine-protein kinase [Mycobacteriales bacterium]
MTSAETERRIAGRYRVVGLLGRGGMGTVWLAEDELLRRPVAVKEIFYPPGLSDHEVEVLRERTMREARAAARLTHPSVVRMYDVVEEDGHPCLVMERLAGRTLAEAVRENGAMSVAAVAGIGLQILGGLEAAHAEGVVHRDVKPSNVVLEDNNRAVLTDFGIAVSAGDSTLTSTGLLVGSPAFMAPERARESRPGPPSDLWSLGATLYTAVEGHPPFPGQEALATLTAVATEDPEPTVLAGPLAPALEGLLRKDPALRLNAAQLRGLLEQAARTGADLPTPQSPTAGAPAGALPGRGAAPSAAERTLALGALDVAAAAGAAHVAGDLPPRYRDPFASPTPMADAGADAGASGPRAGASDAGGAGAASGVRRRRVAVLAGALVAIAVVGTLVGLALSGGPAHPTAGAPAHPTRSAAPKASASASAPAHSSAAASTPPPSASPEPVAATSGAVPAGWVSYHSPDGWTLAHPANWTTSVQNGQTDFTAPGGATHLRVDTTNTPGPSTVAAWQDQEKSFSAQHASYHRLYLGPVAYRDYHSADWTFQWQDGAALLQANDRGMVTGGKGYALFLEAPAAQWNADQPLLQGFYSTFQP